MGKRHPNRGINFDDDLLFVADLDIDEFENDQFEWRGRRSKAGSRKHRDARNRFSDYKGERWLKQQADDLDDFDVDFDDDLIA